MILMLILSFYPEKPPNNKPWKQKRLSGSAYHVYGLFSLLLI